MKVSLSLTKIDQCMEFVKKMTLPKSVEIDSRPRSARLSMDGKTPNTTPSSHRPSSVPLIVPGKCILTVHYTGLSLNLHVASSFVSLLLCLCSLVQILFGLGAVKIS